MKLKINNKQYELKSNLGSVEFMREARRNVVRLDTKLSYTDFLKVGIKDGIKWSITEKGIDKDGKEILNEFDNSKFSLLGDIVIHNNGLVSFFMCEATNAELLQTVINDLLEV